MTVLRVGRQGRDRTALVRDDPTAADALLEPTVRRALRV